MTIIIKSKTTKKDVEKLLLKFNKPSKIKSLRKVYGKFPIEGNAVVIQKKMRNEWD